jgi:predicted amidohydrolase YtcJ
VTAKGGAAVRDRIEPDLIIVNGDIRTMDPMLPQANALAIGQGLVMAVGGDDEIRSLAAHGTRVVDAGGRLVLPGFQDTHIHLQDGGTDRALCVDLESARTAGELQGSLRDFAARNPAAAWVKGVGWNSGIFGEHNLSRHVLDAAVAERPVFLVASDGHSAVMNSRACEVLGLTASSSNPPNGHFVRESNSAPQGLAYEDAVGWVRERLPPLTDEDHAAGVRHAQRLCNRHGITGVIDALVEERHMRVYKSLDERGELTVRVAATAKVHPSETVDAAMSRLNALRCTYRSPMVKMHSAKFFLDGVFENRTAAMIEDYSDDAGGNAPVMFQEDHLAELFTAFDAARFQIHVHVIGDRAARAALDALEIAINKNSAWPSLHQLAHVQVLDPADIPRFQKLGVVANIQPLWARHEPSVDNVALPMVGETRGRWMYAFRSLLDHGAMIAVSSDWSVSTLDPFLIMQSAITRQPPRCGSNHPVFLPEERISLGEVVRGYTVNAAASAWRSDISGSLVPGKLADLIILDRNIFNIDPHDIGGTEVLLTLLGGREVHRAKSFGG